MNLNDETNEEIKGIPSLITLTSLILLFLLFVIQSGQLSKVVKLIMEESEVMDQQLSNIKSQI